MKTVCYGFVFVLLATMTFGQDQRTIRPRAEDTETRRWAILVGVNEYDHIRNLQYCVNDVTTLRDELLKHGYEAKRIDSLLLHRNKLLFP